MLFVTAGDADYYGLAQIYEVRSEEEAKRAESSQKKHLLNF